MNRFFLFILFSSLFLSCTKDDNEFRTNELQSPIVEGFYMRDEFGMTIGAYGSSSTPNVKLGNNGNDSWSSEYYFTVYPNPVRFDRGASVFIKSPPNTLKKFWITPANAPQGSNYSNATVLVAGGYPIFQLETFESRLWLDGEIIFKGLPEGYYRAYLEMDEILLFDNLLFIKPIK